VLTNIDLEKIFFLQFFTFISPLSVFKKIKKKNTHPNAQKLSKPSNRKSIKNQ